MILRKMICVCAILLTVFVAAPALASPDSEEVMGGWVDSTLDQLLDSLEAVVDFLLDDPTTQPANDSNHSESSGSAADGSEQEGTPEFGTTVDPFG